MLTEVERRLDTAFRIGVRRAYANKCCVTGAENGLEAAHIRPFAVCKKTRLAISVKNGFLVTAGLHRLYDKHQWSIEPEKGVAVFGERLKKDPFWGKLDGKEVDFPKQEEDRPFTHLLRELFTEFLRKQTI